MNNLPQLKEVIILASNKKEAIKYAESEYIFPSYIRPYRYSSKGNNFYLFHVLM